MMSRLNSKTLFVAGLLLCGLVLIQSCESGPPTPPPSANQERSSTGSPAAQAQTQPGSPVALDDLLLRSNASLQVLSTYDFKNLNAGEQRYLDMFGVRHARMAAQEVQIGADKGTATFVEFSSPSEAEQAASKSREAASRRPTKTLCYGKIVVLLQTSGSLDQFAGPIEADLNNRVSGAQ